MSEYYKTLTPAFREEIKEVVRKEIIACIHYEEYVEESEEKG
jgi:hypothetical protein